MCWTCRRDGGGGGGGKGQKEEGDRRIMQD